ncbi:MAG: hypothetical protein JNL83_38405 [Myxococcales bacterium]|nr:hypothetical protein [Myxococcales bacterium]
MRRAVVLGYGILAYASFLVTFTALFLFAGNIGVVRGIDEGPGTATGAALAIDLGLVALFGATHSILARPAVKRHLPPELERSTYVVVANATLALAIWQWRAMPDVVWSLAVPAAVSWLVAGAAVALVVWSTFLTDHFDLFGLRQVWLYARGVPYTPVPFVERWIYTRVRHPMMLGVLIWLWAVPVMTVGHLVFSLGMTVYILVGVALEERGLVASLGAPYAAYRRRVRAFLPFPRG